MSKERQYEKFTLPSGREVEIWVNATGLANLNAQRAVKNEPDAMMFALMAQLVRIDAKHLPYEQLLTDLSWSDTLALQGRVFADSAAGDAIVKKSSPDAPSPS